MTFKALALALTLTLGCLTGCAYVMEMAKGQISVAGSVPLDDALLGRLTKPAGFKVTVWAKGLGDTRGLTFAPDGAAYVARRKQGDVILLRDGRHTGRADAPVVVAKGIAKANDVALHGGRLYVTAASQVMVADRASDGTLGPHRVALSDLPEGGQHYTRTLAFGPDGKLYVSIGSSCNACVEETPERAAIVRARADGSEREVFASGLRNTIGFDWHPTTGALWGMDQGSDMRGPNQPGEELNEIVQGGHYGWPHCFGDRQPDPEFSAPPPRGTQDDFCATTRPAALSYQAHSSPLDFVFYKGNLFPEAYRGDAFATMHGSWNRVPAAGYRVVRVKFENGRPVRFEDFVTGFLLPDGKKQFGRPSGLAVAPDGALYFTDDSQGVIYRIGRV